MYSSCQKNLNDSDNVALINVNIIPMTENIVYENYAILISNHKIKAIGKYKELEIPQGTKIIDAENKYLIPGLGDMHAHIPTDIRGNLLYDSFDLFLSNGVTFIRNMWGTQATLNFREQINNKEIEGPEIYTTGPLIDGLGTRYQYSFSLTDPEKVEDAITGMKNSGYNAIKVYDYLSLDVYLSIIETSKKLKIPVVGHIPYSVGLERVLESGQLSIEHFRGYKDYYLDDEIINKTIESGIWNCPTLIVKYNINNLEDIIASKPYETKYMPQEVVNGWNAFIFRNDNDIYYSELESEKLLYILHQRGGGIVAGTDCGLPYVIPGFSLHEELELMNKAGLTPYEALLTATFNAATLLGFEDRLGTIEEGKDADLVLLEKNPLENISNTKSIIGLFVKGKWYSKEDLENKLESIEIKNL